MPQIEPLPRTFLTRRRVASAVLLLQMLAVGGVLLALGKFQPFLVPDTPLYADYPMHSLEEALKNHRTPVYPLFLRAMRPWSPEFHQVPAAQYAFYCLAVAVFFRGLLAVGQGEISAALTAGMLLYSNLLFHFVNQIGSDCPAATFAIFTLGFVLMRLGGKTGVPTLLAISTATFLTWLTRPAYLFLVVLVPLVCELGKTQSATARSRWRSRLEILSATLLPLLAWCMLQWAVVGRFAVVSLGGYNLIGISGQFLDDFVLHDLPEHLQPLGQGALENRLRMADQLAMPDADPLNYMRMESQYDDTLWRIFVPAAEDVLGKDSHDAVNSQLKDMAKAIIRQRPTEYLTWLVKAFRRGMEKLASEFMLNPASLVLFLCTLAAILWGIVRSFHGQEQPFMLSRATGLLFLIAVLFALMKLAVVILVSIPIGRMTMAMGLFVPVVFMAFLTDLAPKLLSKRHALKPPGGRLPR